MSKMKYFDKEAGNFLSMELGGGGCYNTEEVITESGEWVAPVTTWYEVIVISGGSGAQVRADGFYWSGMGQEPKSFLRYYTKGKQIHVVIGAGGKSVFANYITNETYTAGASQGAGVTSFGDCIVPNLYTQGIRGTDVVRYNRNNIMFYLVGYGGGVGTYNPDSYGPVIGYGGGGSARLLNKSSSTTEPFTNPEDYELIDGKQGCVKLRYYNPDK